MHQLIDRASGLARARSGLAGALWLLVGCGSAVTQDSSANDGDSSTAVGVATISGSATVTSSPPVTTLPPVTSPDAESLGTTSDSGSLPIDGSGAFPCFYDPRECHLECDLFAQDCPDGQKCSSWANDGGMVRNATKCVPVDEQPDGVGESCTVEGSEFSGVDSCELGAKCFDVDRETSVGECHALCGGDPFQPTCDEGSACSMDSEGTLTICIPTCDPSMMEACGPAEVCAPYNSNFFSCVLAADVPGALLDPCDVGSGCEAGLFCALAGRLDACESETGCCTPYCDLDAPACPETTACEPYFGQAGAPEGLEHVGVCSN